MRAEPFLFAAILVLAGCSAEVDTVEMRPQESSSVVDGLPFRVAEPYDVVVWQRQPTGSMKEVYRQRMELPNPDRLFLLRYTGLPLSDATSSVKLNPNGTLSKVDVSSESQAAAAVAETGKQIQDVNAAVVKAEAAGAATQAAKVKVSSDAADRELAYAKAVQAALDKADEVDTIALGSGSRAAAERALVVLEIDANNKAGLANHPPPFPGAHLTVGD
jgi:hypothetical protein